MDAPPARDDADGCPEPCLHAMARGEPMPSIDDEEGLSVPEGLGEIVDAHVHLFPPRVFDAVHRWFERHAWSVRYRFHSEQVLEFLHARGVRRCVALHYSHAPGMARILNRYVHEVARAHRDVVVPLGTVLPGESEAVDVVHEALHTLDLAGLKLHCHVQKFAPDHPSLDPIWAACEAAGKPVLVHAGREPRSPAYGVDTHAICAVDRVARVLERYPRLRLVVPHLGADEIPAYVALMEQHENLWLDTTMAVAGFFPGWGWEDVVRRVGDRLIYGTDFPNIPYAWDRELRRLSALGLPPGTAERLFGGNARRVFGL